VSVKDGEAGSRLHLACAAEYEAAFGVPWDRLPGRRETWTDLCQKAGEMDRRSDEALQLVRELGTASIEARKFLQGQRLPVNKSLFRTDMKGRTPPEFVLAFLYAKHLIEVTRMVEEVDGPVDRRLARREASGHRAFAREAAQTRGGRNAIRDLCISRALREVVYKCPYDADPPRRGMFRPALARQRFTPGSWSWRRGLVVEVLDAFPMDTARHGGNGSKWPTDREIAVVSLLLRQENLTATEARLSADTLIQKERRAIHELRDRRGLLPRSATRAQRKRKKT
jgi:hypothetical protein